jgi:rubrerythrin
MNTFKASEMFQVAMRIEENGERLYRHAVNLTDDTKMKDMFNFVADEEVKHRKTFEGMLSKIESYQPSESYPGEYFAYLKAYAENVVFPEDQMERELAKITDVGGALEFAIQREIESILYYLEARGFVPESQRSEIDRIIEEERRHYLKLVDVRRSLN